MKRIDYNLFVYGDKQLKRNKNTKRDTKKNKNKHKSEETQFNSTFLYFLLHYAPYILKHIMVIAKSFPVFINNGFRGCITFETSYMMLFFTLQSWLSLSFSFLFSIFISSTELGFNTIQPSFVIINSDIEELDFELKNSLKNFLKNAAIFCYILSFIVY